MKRRGRVVVVVGRELVKSISLPFALSCLVPWGEKKKEKGSDSRRRGAEGPQVSYDFGSSNPNCCSGILSAAASVWWSGCSDCSTRNIDAHTKWNKMKEEAMKTRKKGRSKNGSSNSRP